MSPPLNVLNTIKRMLAQFFWSSKIGEKGKHWVNWQTVCLPQDEGGLGFRRISDIYMALFC